MFKIKEKSLTTNFYPKIFGSNKHIVLFNIMFLTKIYYYKMSFPRYNTSSILQWGSVCESLISCYTVIGYTRLRIVNYVLSHASVR